MNALIVLNANEIPNNTFKPMKEMLTRELLGWKMQCSSRSSARGATLTSISKQVFKAINIEILSIAQRRYEKWDILKSSNLAFVVELIVEGPLDVGIHSCGSFTSSAGRDEVGFF